MLGQTGDVLRVLTAPFSTTGAVNAGLYPSIGLSAQLASVGQFPPACGRSIGRFPVRLLVMAAPASTLVVGFDVNTIASIGSAGANIIVLSVIIDFAWKAKARRAEL